jgi:O-methyltransferase
MMAPKKWEQDSHFLKLYAEVKRRTLIDVERLFMLYQFATYAEDKLGGMVAEVGVYRGGSAKILVDRFPGRSVLLFDTFEGMPEVTPGLDLHKKGQYSDTTVEEIRDFLATPSVIIREGKFPDSLHSVDVGPFCFVHADADIFESTMNICEFFFEKLVPGGILLFDDYGAVSCPGCRKAVDEYFGPSGTIYLPTGQAFYLKR